jgi:hypothetical protein
LVSRSQAQISPAARSCPSQRSAWRRVTRRRILAAKGVVEDTGHEGLRKPLRKARVSLQRLKTWKRSPTRPMRRRKYRILHLYALMDGTEDVEPGDPEVVMCLDEFATCSQRTTSAATGSMGTSSRANAAASSCPSAATSKPVSAWGPHRDRAALRFRQMMEQRIMLACPRPAATRDREPWSRGLDEADGVAVGVPDGGDQLASADVGDRLLGLGAGVEKLAEALVDVVDLATPRAALNRVVALARSLTG